jgi:hypothetical protein
VIQRTSDAAVYVEGSISYVRVTEGSRTILDAEPQGVGQRRVLNVALDPGTYLLTSYQRPCGGNCGTLDPPTDRCSTEFRIKGVGAQATVLIALRPGEGCTAVASF